jgi:hypothetical protein
MRTFAILFATTFVLAACEEPTTNNQEVLETSTDPIDEPAEEAPEEPIDLTVDEAVFERQSDWVMFGPDDDVGEAAECWCDQHGSRTMVVCVTFWNNIEEDALDVPLDQLQWETEARECFGGRGGGTLNFCRPGSSPPTL